MKTFLIFMICLSCTSVSTTNTYQEKDPWLVLENFLKKSLSVDQIVEYLGKPKEIVKAKDGTSNWIYYDSKTSRQSWAIGISEANDNINGMSYIPGSSGTKLLVKDLEDRWKNRECTHDKETILIAGHNYSKQKFIKCDSGRIRAKYNRFGEVEGVSVE